MAEAQIGNSIGALQDVTTFVGFKTAGGELIKSGLESYCMYQASGAIVKGEAVQLVVPSATVPATVVKAVVSIDQRVLLGIAENSAASGAMVKVCVSGITEIYVNAQTVAFGDTVFAPGTNAGECTCSATEATATTIVGGVVGSVLAAKNASNLAPALVRFL